MPSALQPKVVDCEPPKQATLGMSEWHKVKDSVLPTKRYCVILREDLGASARKPTEGSRSDAEACKTTTTQSFDVRGLLGLACKSFGARPATEILRSR